MQEMYELEFKQLKENPQIVKMVNEWLIARGLDSTCKGFEYTSEIISLLLIKKKYSRDAMASLFGFIAYKNGIKEFSVQRQMRYVCTIKTKNKYIVNDICSQAWYDIRNALEKQEGNGND